MLNEYLDEKLTIQLKSKNQWTELKKLCKANNFITVKYGEDKFEYPMQCLITYIGATGQPIICPSKDNAEACILRGWKVIEFNNFKEII